MDYVFKQLNLLEKDYFGLRFVDSNNQRVIGKIILLNLIVKYVINNIFFFLIQVWLDPTRLIFKQVKNLNPIIFAFRVKFYPADPTLLKEELTRYYLYLQLRRDLINRRLYCLPTDATFLMACVAQCNFITMN